MSKRDPLTTSAVACQWERTQQGWTLWVRGRPEVNGRGTNFEDARAALIDAIMEAAPDLDTVEAAIPDFDPPLPVIQRAEKYVSPELHFIDVAETFELHHGPGGATETPKSRAAYFESLFTDGICGLCHHGRGMRTDILMRADYVTPRVDGGLIGAPFGPCIRVFSDRFAALLTPDERDRLKLVPIDTPSSARRRFFEARGTSNVPYVHPAALEADGKECGGCERRFLRSCDPRLMEDGLHLVQFVCLEDLPSPLPGLFLVGTGCESKLCATRQRWDEIRGSRGARGLVSHRLGVVRAADCERSPRIRKDPTNCGLCRQWPPPRTLDDRQCAVFPWPADLCSQRNFEWFAAAEAAGYVKFGLATTTPLAIWGMLARGERPQQTEFVSFRCTGCWRLGWIVHTPRELQLAWPLGIG